MSQISSLKETLSQALQHRIIPNQEFILQGSILDSAVDHLMHRLKGLCDNVDTSPETFHDLEICFSLRQPNQQAPLILRVRRALDKAVPFQLRYLGQPEIDRSRPTLVRSSIDVGCTSTVLDFLTEIGCRVEFEYIIRGFPGVIGCVYISFSFGKLAMQTRLTPTGNTVVGWFLGFMFRKGRMKISVSKVIKINPGKQQDVCNEPISQSYLVELSVIAPNGQDSIGDEMRSFAEQLKPLVQLEKIDYKRLSTVS